MFDGWCMFMYFPNIFLQTSASFRLEKDSRLVNVSMSIQEFFFCGQLLQKLPSQVYFPPSQVYAPVGNAAPNFSFDGLTKNNNSFTLMYSSLSTFYSCLPLATPGALVFTLAFYRPAAATFSDFSAFHCISLHFFEFLCFFDRAYRCPMDIEYKIV